MVTEGTGKTIAALLFGILIILLVGREKVQ